MVRVVASVASVAVRAWVVAAVAARVGGCMVAEGAPEDTVVVGVVLDEHLGAEGDAVRLQVLEQTHLLHDREDLLHVDRA